MINTPPDLEECEHFHRYHGIVHLDLYPSNIMWKYDSKEGIIKKIIDWDSGNFIEETISEKVQHVLNDRAHLISKFSPLDPIANITTYDWIYYNLLKRILRIQNVSSMIKPF